MAAHVETRSQDQAYSGSHICQTAFAARDPMSGIGPLKTVARRDETVSPGSICRTYHVADRSIASRRLATNLFASRLPKAIQRCS